MRTIHIFEHDQDLFQAGDDICYVREKYRHMKGDLLKNREFVSQKYGGSCSSTGCSCCDIPDCFFSEFIRIYWNCPYVD